MKDGKHLLFLSREISGGTSPRARRFLRGSFAKGCAKIGEYLSYTSLKSYGAFFLSFGLVTLLLNLGKYYVLDNPEIRPGALAVGVILSLLAIPLMFSDKPMCIGMQDFPLTDYVFFEFLCVKRQNRINNPPSIPVFISIFIGLIPATLGFLFPLEYVLLTLLVCVVLFLSFTSLEFPMILALLAMPYLSFTQYKFYVIAAISVLSFLGYLVRVLIGKRSYHLDVFGVGILLFGVLTCIAAATGLADSSRENAYLYFALLLGYYPASGLVVNRRLTDAAIKAIVFSTLPLAVYSIVRVIASLVKGGYRSPAFFYGSETGGAESFVISAYLLVSAVFTLMFFLEKSRKVKRAFYAFFFAIDVIAILTLLQLGVILSLAMALILALAVFKRNKAGYFIFPFTVLPYLIPILPDRYLEKITQLFNLKTPLGVISDGLFENISVGISNVFFGVGIGKDSYDAFLSESADRFDNLFVGILSSIGALALIVLVSLLIFAFFESALYSRYVKHSSVHVASKMSTVALAALIIHGAFGNIFEYPELFYMFFVILGISLATMRVAKKETDDRLNYYGDARSSQTSEIDINIA